MLFLQGREEIFKEMKPEEAKGDVQEFETSRTPFNYKVSGDSMKVTFDYKVENDAEEGEESKE